MDESQILDAVAAARYVGLSASTLAKMRLSGNGPAFLKLGRRVLYRRADLDAWLESRLARNTSDADARLSKSLTGPERNGRSSIQSRIVTVLRDHSLDDIARLPKSLTGLQVEKTNGPLKANPDTAPSRVKPASAGPTANTDTRLSKATIGKSLRSRASGTRKS
jgi:excisionase family DNA binding protein